MRIPYLNIVVAALTAFVVGALWYSPLLFGNTYAALRGLDPATAGVTPPLWELAGEFGRCLAIGAVLAYLLARLRPRGWTDSMMLALWLWVGFQAMLLLGSVLHEAMPMRLYAIHTGDALMKTLAMAAVLTAWPRGTSFVGTAPR